MFSKDNLFPLNEQSLFFYPKKINKYSKMFPTDVLVPLNKQSKFFFSNNINKELDVFNRYVISLKWTKFIFLPQEI